MEAHIAELHRVAQQQFTEYQATTAALQARKALTEQAATMAAAASTEVTQASAEAMATALAAAGIGTAPRAALVNTNKYTAKMPIFKKEEGEDFLIF